MGSKQELVISPPNFQVAIFKYARVLVFFTMLTLTSCGSSSGSDDEPLALQPNTDSHHSLEDFLVPRDSGPTLEQRLVVIDKLNQAIEDYTLVCGEVAQEDCAQ